MEIFGIGGAELVAILIIMLLVAGPKRMIQWAYVLGQYVAKFRAMWDEVMAGVQKEIEEAGIDMQLPKSIPTRANLLNPMNNVWAGITAPVQEVMKDVSAEIQQTQSELREVVQEEKVAS
jgi:Sec-independent protein translocase protein TatA